jgi:hypothetical protein
MLGVTVLKKLENITDYKEKEIYKTMGKTIKLKESELIQLIEDTARKQILVNAKSKDTNLDSKISKVTKRFSKVLNKVSESTNNEKIEVIRKETIKLREAGYSYLIIGESFKLCSNSLNEGFLDTSNTLKNLLGTAFSSVSDSAKEYAYDWLLGLLGIPPGNFKNAMVISLGNVPVTEIPKLLTDCQFTSEYVAKGIVEYVIELIKEDITGEAGAGALGKLIRNMVEKKLGETEAHKDIMSAVQGLICNSDNTVRGIEDIGEDLISGDFISKASGGGGKGEAGSLASIVGL